MGPDRHHEHEIGPGEVVGRALLSHDGVCPEGGLSVVDRCIQWQVRRAGLQEDLHTWRWCHVQGLLGLSRLWPVQQAHGGVSRCQGLIDGAGSGEVV